MKLLGWVLTFEELYDRCLISNRYEVIDVIGRDVYDLTMEKTNAEYIMLIVLGQQNNLKVAVLNVRTKEGAKKIPFLMFESDRDYSDMGLEESAERHDFDIINDFEGFS